MIVWHVNPISLGKILGAMYVTFGLVAGLIISSFSVLGVATGGIAVPNQIEDLPGLLFGASAVLFLPLAYGALGFVGGLIAAFVYNWVVRFVGGIEIEVA